MMQTMTHPESPLAQMSRPQRLPMNEVATQFSHEDQAVLRHILSGKGDYVESVIFHEPDAARKVFDDAPPIARPDTSWYHPVMENISESRLKKGNMGSVLLTAKEEAALFLQFNYCRFRVAEVKQAVGDDEMTMTQAREMLGWHQKAEAYRDQIAQTNLALVLAMAKRTRLSEVDFSDLVSEGNMALLRAVDKFDVARGFKFSTYACRAILKAFSRSGVKLSKYRQIFPTDFDPKLEKSDYMQVKRATHEEDCVDEIGRIVRENRAELTDIEQSVIEHRFGLSTKPKVTPEHTQLTLEQVGRIIGVTKERVRQIQNKALEKIKTRLEDDFLL